MLLVALAFLAGCAHDEPRPLDVREAATRFDRRSLDDPGLATFVSTRLQPPPPVWPPARWDFTNLTIAAVYFHPDLAVARAHLGVAAAGRITAGERPNPVLSVTPAYNTTTRLPSPWLVTPSLDVPIETAGKRGHRQAQAAHLAEAARFTLAASVWQVRSEVRRRMVGLQFAGLTRELLAGQESLHAENLKLLEQQRDAGVISAFELTQARVLADQARLAARDAARQETEARVRLANAIGLPADALERVAVSFAGLDAAPDAPPPDALARRQALLNRPDLLAALAEYAAAEDSLALEIARQYPDVHLSPGYEFDQGDNKWSLGLNVTLPILNQNQGAIAEARARRTEAAARFEALQARVIGETERAVAAYRGAIDRQADTVAFRTHLDQQVAGARAQHQAGGISRAELVGVQLQQSVAALAGLEARRLAQEALGQLEDALQSPPLLPSGLAGATSTSTPAPPARKDIP